MTEPPPALEENAQPYESVGAKAAGKVTSNTAEVEVEGSGTVTLKLPPGNDASVEVGGTPKGHGPVEAVSHAKVTVYESARALEAPIMAITSRAGTTQSSFFI